MRVLKLLSAAALLALVPAAKLLADATYIYAVQINAVVQTSPPKITLNWVGGDPYGPMDFVIYRKAKADTSWGSPIASLSGTATSFPDTAVSVGGAYEYQIIKHDSSGFVGYGYIFAGIQAPLIDNRGTLILIIETNATASLQAELAQLQTDLVGDGWTLRVHGVSSSDTPDSVKALIASDYYSDPANVNAVFLLGHVPVLQSGNLNYDGHESRPMPADAFYGDMNNDWPTGGDPTTRPWYLPSKVALMVGRVDFFNMPGTGASPAWPSETGLLQRYLNKDHRWRTKQIAVSRRALMGDSRGSIDGNLAVAASGYRNFDPLVGANNTVIANVQAGSPINQRWISLLGSGSYLLAYGCGGGGPSQCGGLGTHSQAGTDTICYSTDVVAQDAHAVFVMLFGSWFAEWDLQDDFMRAFLATPTMGLVCVESGEPHWFIHHIGLGETIGYSTWLTMNNSTLYQNQENDFTQAIYIALMGDPTLRLDPVAPCPWLSANANGNTVNLSWGNSSDAVVGYHVYRATSANGPFTRLTSSPIAAGSYSDVAVPTGNYTYMVRAVALQTTPSGSYYNPSQGAFASATVVTTTGSPIRIQAARSGSGLKLTWNSVSGTVYHVQARDSITGSWATWTGPITATNGTTFWTEPNIGFVAQRYYRVVSP